MPNQQASWLAPRGTREVVIHPSHVSNLWLRLYQYLPASLIEDRSGKHGALNDIAASSSTVLDAQLLRELAARQKAVLASLAPLGYQPLARVRFRLTSSLTCGLSTPNLVERGMTLLRPYGIPVLPGSAVKGAIAAHLAEILAGKLHVSDGERERSLREAGLLELFGFGPKGGQRARAGNVVFCDALPESGTLRVDITTPHHARYYQGKEKAAAGFEMPNPLPFLSVAEGSVFIFPIAVRPGADWRPPGEQQQERLRAFEITRFDSLAAILEDALASTGKYKGFGAQTNVGYGRFEPAPENETAR